MYESASIRVCHKWEYKSKCPTEGNEEESTTEKEFDPWISEM